MLGVVSEWRFEMALHSQDEVDREVNAGKRISRWARWSLILFVLLAVVFGMDAFLTGRSWSKYELVAGVGLFTWFLIVSVDLLLASLYKEFRLRTSEISGKLSAIEKAVTDTLIVTRVSMHEYLAEQAAWKTTERLDGRTDDEIETEYNPESHDLVVKGIKCVEVANDYERGNSVPQNQELAEAWFRKAVPWYELAAKKGDSYAQEKLGDFCSEGKGVRRDDAKAMYWWSESAQRGRASAQYRLGEKFYFGNNVEKNLAEAFVWFEVVIMSHPAGFIELKRQAASYRDDAAQRLTPGELTQARERTRKWLQDHPAKQQ
jgi:hypothetical protein